MKSLVSVLSVALLAGCAGMSPEERAALDLKISTEIRECKAQGRIPIVDSERKGTTVCADEHMMAMWRSQGQQCASNPYGTPVYRGNYYGQQVIFDHCNIDHWAKQQAKGKLTD